MAFPFYEFAVQDAEEYREQLFTVILIDHSSFRMECKQSKLFSKGFLGDKSLEIFFVRGEIRELPRRNTIQS